MAILNDHDLRDVPVATGAAGQFTVSRSEYFEPPHVSPGELSDMMASGDPLKVDYASSYLNGAFHETVMFRGAVCVDGCGKRLDRITSKMRWGHNEEDGFAREREFPFRATLKQIRGGGTCACGGRLVFEFERGPEGGAMETTEVERC